MACIHRDAGVAAPCRRAAVSAAVQGEIRRYQRGGKSREMSTNDCGVSLSQNNIVTLVPYVIRVEILLVKI